MKLTIATSNRNRLDPSKLITQFFFKSLENQTFRDFELVVADGGSKNIEELKLLEKKLSFKFRVVSHIIGEKFERAKLNNVAVRNGEGEYRMTTDVDMLFAPNFLKSVMDVFLERPEVFVESRTMYLKSPWINQQIYSNRIDPFKDVEQIKTGRIKKRTTAGGCQCMNIKNWEKIRGFDEEYVGWGSEDYDLLGRVSAQGIKVVWLGETRGSIELFHQPHSKSGEQIKEDLACQAINQKRLNKSQERIVNPHGWGGIYENI